MSINNIEQNFGDNSTMFAGGSKFFDEKTGTYKGGDSDVSFFEDPDKNVQATIKEKFSGLIPSKADYALREEYSVPLNHIKQQVEESIFIYGKLLENIDSIMNKINIDYSKDANLEESHKMLWREVVKFNDITTEYINQISKTNSTKDVNSLYPNYISFEEYLYAIRSKSISSQRLVKEYKRLSSHSVFSYLLDLRELVNYILNEIYFIRQTLIDSFGEEYEDDSQKQIGVQLDSWAKMSLHYAQRITDTIVSVPKGIPIAEVDKITEKQAVEFQAFFAIRLDAVNDEIDSILQSIKRDLVDNSEIFYSRYLEQALTFRNKIVNSMELDYHTTSFTSVAPFLTEELLIATNVMNSNFGMILTDMVQRHSMITAKVDEVISTISDKRKYSNYIFQLSTKGNPKKIITKTVTNDIYSIIFKSSINYINIESDLLSNHASLDNLTENHHPQYLLRNGGSITGDITVENSATVDGVHLSTHAHNGLDGSAKIKSTDIDYESARLTLTGVVPSPLSISIDSLINDIIDGGVPVVDVVVAINTGDDSLLLDYEIIVAEVD